MVRLSSVVCPSVHHGCIMTKRYEIVPRLLLITYRKSHAYWLSNDIIVDDLEGP